jgi:hypothetical protein
MKQLIFLLGLLASQSQELLAQADLPPRQIVYKTKVQSVLSGQKIGYLRFISDSTILLSPERLPLGPVAPISGELHSYHYRELDLIQLRRQGIVPQGVIIGAVAGCATGLIFGYIASQPVINFGNSEEPGNRYVGKGALIGTISGAILGAVFASFAHKTFVILGNKQKFTEVRQTLLERMYNLPAKK